MGHPSNRRKQGGEEPPGHNSFSFSDRIAERFLLTVERLCKLFVALAKVVVPVALTLLLTTCGQKTPLPGNQQPQQPQQQPVK